MEKKRQDKLEVPSLDRAWRLYTRALREKRCAWKPDPSVSFPELSAAIEQAERSPGTKVIKEETRIRVLHARVLGHDVLIKRYELISLGDRLKYLFRVSRARRAWAAACAMSDIGIPTPKPLGLLEIHSGIHAIRSYFITAFMTDAKAARKWIKPWLSARPPEFRAQFRKEVMNLLLNLYRNGVYHADTKSANLLLRSPGDPAQRAFFWIDLECVKFGVQPTRRQIIRNLVQLNGSLGSKVAEEDRKAFLHEMSAVYPWLSNPRVEKTIRRWTHRRLIKQKLGGHGA